MDHHIDNALEHYFGWMRNSPTWAPEYATIREAQNELARLRIALVDYENLHESCQEDRLNILNENDTLRSVIYNLYLEVGGSPTKFPAWLDSMLNKQDPPACTPN